MKESRSKFLKSSKGRRQSGVALVTALLIVALATVAAVAMTSQQQLNIRKTSNILIAGQNYLNALGGEQWAVDILLQDYIKDDKNREYVDALTEKWAKPLPAIPLDNGGVISGQIVDLQSRFNVNNLYINERDAGNQNSAGYIYHEKVLEYFGRILALLNVDEDLAATIADWIDEDAKVAFPDGAEDETYMSSDNPYRTPGMMIASLSEIRQVKGVTDKVYKKIEPYLTVLPGTATKLNVNTAPDILLKALDEDLEEEEVSDLMDYRDDKTFKSSKDFVNKLRALMGDPSPTATPAPQATPAPLQIDPVEALVGVNSIYFEASVKVEMGKARMRLNSLIQRKKDNLGKLTAPVVRRSRGVI